MASSRFQLISKKFVKPSISTPPSLRNYKLCLMDQLLKTTYVPMAFFYPNQHHKQPDNTSQTSSRLEESLSKILSSYYPFAGRLTDNISVNCNDMGATFLEARIRCPMSEILNGANANAQDIIFPSGSTWSSGHDQPSPLVAQLNHFDCGGKALSVSMNHKIGDGHTLCNFISDWAAMARRSSGKPSPQFIGASIFPPKDDPSFEPVFESKQGQNCITRRYVFDHKKISQLKAKATAESGVQKPTRVEVVSALLYKCAMSSSLVHSPSFKPSVLAFIVNLRSLIGLPTEQNCVGNLLSNFPILTTNERDVNFSRLVSEIRRAKIQHFEQYKGIKTNDLISATLEKAELLTALQGKNDIDGYTCSSFCRYPTYDIDFGWGKPIRVSFAACPYKNFFVMMENRNFDNIEVIVTLEEQVMSVFQSDPELLAFTSSSSF